MPRHRAISLVGLPGSGKTTIGRALAGRLARSFLDTDQLIEDRLGCSIKQFFETRGEEAFRDVESDVIASIAGRGDCVVSTGGGAVLRASNRTVLREQTHAFYLRASVEDLYRRLKKDTKRPLLQVPDPLGRLREMHANRDPLYREVAELVVDTGKVPVQALVSRLVSQVELMDLNGPTS